jgi:hypothetical protein
MGVGLVGEDLPDPVSGGGELGRGELPGWLFEVEFEFGFAGTERLDCSGGMQAGLDVGVVVKGAAFECGQVAVDDGGSHLELVLDGGEVFGVSRWR